MQSFKRNAKKDKEIRECHASTCSLEFGAYVFFLILDAFCCRHKHTLAVNPGKSFERKLLSNTPVLVNNSRSILKHFFVVVVVVSLVSQIKPVHIFTHPGKHLMNEMGVPITPLRLSESFVSQKCQSDLC